MSLIEIIQLTISIITLLAFIFAIYKYFRDPDVKNASSIKEMGIACDYRHQAIDKDISSIKESVHLLRVNHIDHIEKDMREIRDKQTKILAILEAEYQVKVES